MAVPAHVWVDLISALNPRSVVGYTHQWQSSITDDTGAPMVGSRHWEWCRDHLMASADSIQEGKLARALGWRFFLAIPESTFQGDYPANGRTVLGAIECPATVSDRTCATCGACDGARRGATKASIFLVEHGMRSQAKAKRVAALQVIR